MKRHFSRSVLIALMVVYWSALVYAAQSNLDRIEREEIEALEDMYLNDKSFMEHLNEMSKKHELAINSKWAAEKAATEDVKTTRQICTEIYKNLKGIREFSTLSEERCVRAIRYGGIPIWKCIKDKVNVGKTDFDSINQCYQQ